MINSHTSYVTITTLPFFGIKAIAIGHPKGGIREFLLLEKHPLAPTGIVQLRREDLRGVESKTPSVS